MNGHIESTWTTTTQQWSEPKFVKGDNLAINGLASGLNYGRILLQRELSSKYSCERYRHASFRGHERYIIKHRKCEAKKIAKSKPDSVVRDKSGLIRLFRPEQHAARMQTSCECVSIPPIPQHHFIRCVSLAVSLNAGFVPPFEAPAILYVRPLAFGSGAQLNIIPPTEFTFCVFVQPTAALLGHAAPVAALLLEEFDRAAPRGTGGAKIGGNYAPLMRWQKRAKEEGFGITLHLDSQTRSEIEEFSAAGFIGVKKNPDTKYTLVIPDNTTSIIQSITSNTCMEIAKSLRWTVEIRPVR